MNNRRILSTALLVLCIALVPAGTYGQENEMKQVAMRSLMEWKKSFTEDQARKLGFDSKEDFQASELGAPFRLYTVKPAALMEYQEGQEFGKLVTETNYSVYPVNTRGNNKALLWMVNRNGKWEVARMGSSKLVKNIMSTEGAMKNQISERGLEGAKPPKFVRIYQLYLDFFFLKAAEREFVVPLRNIPDLKTEGGKFYVPSQVVPQWKEQLKKKTAPKEKGKEIIEG